MPRKQWLIACLMCIFPFVASAQGKVRVTPLEPVSHSETLQPGSAAIYGNFIQRLGFSSGGYAQEIYLFNSTNGKLYSMRVKATMKSAKENLFCFHLPPGRYELRQYYWTQSKWYGGMVHLEQITQNYSFDELQELAKEGKQEGDLELLRFAFTVQADTLYYAGTWHFESPKASFSDDKTAFDMKAAKMYKKLDFSTAVTRLPE